jgi:hypothetical protein
MVSSKSKARFWVRGSEVQGSKVQGSRVQDYYTDALGLRLEAKN